jgi:hypothetical protein
MTGGASADREVPSGFTRPRVNGTQSLQLFLHQ